MTAEQLGTQVDGLKHSADRHQKILEDREKKLREEQMKIKYEALDIQDPKPKQPEQHRPS